MTEDQQLRGRWGLLAGELHSAMDPPFGERALAACDFTT